ncbi:MAG: Unknown protein [uncultured Thiotrichaceae bacterium]|uniref:Outer membrane lipoprotein-sorting protein n=1 Tax=uncultured Thiotrichaceae bacterium TaxID=298394 RepID=A0A6S6U5B5_9GAMM|nr:MAG: Unknown protein [uncultured Thiotrichaceae bacterium]
MKHLLLAVATFIYLGGSVAFAFEPSAPPYPKGAFPDNCSINQLQPIAETSRTETDYKSQYTAKSGAKSYSLTIDMDYGEKTFGLYAGLSSGKQELIRKVMIGDYPTYIDQVYSGFLNEDKQLDFIVNMQAGDKNLMGNRQHSYFILSKGNRYAVRKITSYALEDKDFYDYTQDDRCEYLHLSFVSDQTQHYWVYNVLQFIDDKIVIKNKLSRYFPKWVTFDNTDKPVTIDVKQKQRLWQDFIRKDAFVEEISEK